ncbi:Spo0E family sporulation regulatory protein-aspartic acid phosphatase [Paenibacillus alkalitolerans]|uniref:Spo0E family sporulation regulatory protein-aspartic acid phosphatase n=1 Tax=Paenibacillus alkalitolerans TaxID=2799335 RepID=UPI0018F46423
MRNSRIEEEMLKLKKLLENTAERYKYDFCHPDVLAVSQRLDQVIVRLLTEHQPES